MRHLAWLIVLIGCGGSASGDGDHPRDASMNDATVVDGRVVDAAPMTPPPVACEAEGGSSTVAMPELVAMLSDRWHESWLSSPAVADLDGDGTSEILAPRADRMLAWHLDGSIVFSVDVEGRIWSSPVVADLVPEHPGLEVAVAARAQIFMWDAAGQDMPGFPVTLEDELRSIAAGDIDGDGRYELVSVTTSPIEANDQRDIIVAVNDDGSRVDGFPPNTTGRAGCDDACYVTGGYDQNLALGDLDGTGGLDIVAPQDNAYVSAHHGDGVAFDCASGFRGRTKFSGVRFLHDWALAQQGYADDEDTALQGHFTNTAPAIADLDRDGSYEIVMLGSVQNAAQSDRFKGVALWVVNPDGTRDPAFMTPFHVPEYVAGLWDFEDNIVGATNQVSIAELDPDRAGLETVFAGFDGHIHAVDASAQVVFDYRYTDSDHVLTPGVAIADLSKDGAPEIVFATYSTETDVSALYILDSRGNELHRIPLPSRGAMSVPTLADVDRDGTLEILVNLKGGDEDRMPQVLVYTVASSGTRCMPWPTGRGNDQRTGYVP